MNLIKLYQLSRGLNVIPGIRHELLQRFSQDDNLETAIHNAIPILKTYPNNQPEYQKNILNFYSRNTIVPFVPISAKGPWIITDSGAVVYDTGGYGMLGFGHSPDWALEILSKPHVMANVMTPSEIQYNFTQELQSHIGQSREKGCPYSKFAFLNSGSEAMELALRISDQITKSSKPSCFIVLEGGFHGRTGNAAKISHSTRNTYQTQLKSFQKIQNPVYPVKVNDEVELEDTFEHASKNYHIEAMIMEPVMGEGNPGIKLSKSFYDASRNLTRKYGSHLIIDSVQAGLRTHGYLSMTDYTHLRLSKHPDFEIFSKAISSGQYPLSVVAMCDEVVSKFRPGIYGNTMTSNPKAMEMGLESLKRVDYNVISNIYTQGENFKKMLHRIRNKYPEISTSVTGSGLLIALHINKKYPVVSENGLEYLCRYNGLNVIHGGDNALRFTPHFLITKNEIELIEKILDFTFNSFYKKIIIDK